jgi:hypothetical protein
MIQEISEYKYLGNGLAQINSNMNEFNVRIDLLYSDISKWNSLLKFNEIASKLSDLSTFLNSYSANWKNSSDLVYNLQGYWEEPVQIAFYKTFNYVANFVEIETWLNDYFPATDFSPTQILRCDFLCKNYSDEMLEGARILNYDSSKLEEIALKYTTTVKKVYRFLGIKNQLNAIISLINFLLKKYNYTNFYVDKIKDLSSYSTFVEFDKSTNIFSSTQLANFSEIDLAYFDSYITQYNNLYNIYKSKYIELEVIPPEEIILFDLKDVAVTSGGAFFYKIINNSWTYHPYSNIEFCPRNICSDCYNSLDLNAIKIQ